MIVPALYAEEAEGEQVGASVVGVYVVVVAHILFAGAVRLRSLSAALLAPAHEQVVLG